MKTDGICGRWFEKKRREVNENPGWGFKPFTSGQRDKKDPQCIDISKFNDLFCYLGSYMMIMDEAKDAERNKQPINKFSLHPNAIKSERELELKSNILSSIEKIDDVITSAFQELEKMEGYTIELESYQKGRKLGEFSTE